MNVLTVYFLPVQKVIRPEWNYYYYFFF